MGINEVRSNGQNVLSQEEIAKRKEAFNKIKENGHDIVLTNKGNNSGVSYDYMDRLNQDVEAGIFEDKNNDGFSNNDKKSLGKEFTSVFSEHGYSTKFNKMHAGDSYAITYDDYIRLANAAGYVLKEEAPVQPVVPEQVTEQVVAPQQVKKEDPTPTEVKTVTDNTQVDENQGEDVIVEFETTTVTDSDGNVIDKQSKSTVTPLFGTATAKKTVTEPDALPAQAPKDKQTSAPAEAPVTPVVNSTKDVKTPVAQAPVTETPAVTPAAVTPETVTPAAETPVTETPAANNEAAINQVLDEDPELAGKTGKERQEILRDREIELRKQQRELAKTSETYQTKGFLGMFKKTKTREYTPEQVAERQAQLQEVNAQLDEVNKYKVYVENVQASDYWTGKYAAQDLKDEQGNVVNQYPTYNRVTIIDQNGNEQRAARVDTYNKETYNYDSKYYSLDVQKVGAPNVGYGTYYSVVPDMNNEIVNYKQQ